MLLVPNATRASFCARKFTSFVDFEQLKMPRASDPCASMLRRNPSAARSSASSQLVGRSAPFTRTRGSVRRGYDRGVPLMEVVYALDGVHGVTYAVSRTSPIH